MQKVGEQQNFLLVTVLNKDAYQCLFVMIPKINQIQCIARKEQDEWKTFQHGWRTTKDKLSTKWFVEIIVEELSLGDVKELCPAALEIEFSTKMLEDMKLRREFS